jgi:benzylsuccinate CoA-transferase BbsF subunit
VSAPFAGIRVLDYCWVGAGALVTKALADHGADVIKIESRTRPDNLRLAPPYRRGSEGLEGSGYFASRNSSKRSFALNMRHPEAPGIARRLAAASSIVTSNFRPGVMDRWGLGYTDLAQADPSIIYLSMPMQGDDGPHRSYVGFGSTIAALAGLVASAGLPERMPVGTGTHYPDHVPNPGHALVALFAAIYERELTGRGRAIEVSQFESTVNVPGPAILQYEATGRVEPRRGNRAPWASPHAVLQAAGEDQWIAVVARDDSEFAALCEVLGMPDLAAEARFARLADRRANEDELESLLTAATGSWDAMQLAAALQARGVPASKVRTSGDLIDDPHLLERGFWRRLEHPVMGSIVVNRVPFASPSDDVGPRAAAPLLGEDTREIAETLLGMSTSEYEDHVAREVFV